MTTVKVYRRNSEIVRITASGHAGYAESGKDIVCAALSAILETAVLGLNRVAKIEVTPKRDERSGYEDIELPEMDATKRHDAQVILATAYVGIADLADGRSRFIKVEDIQL